MVAADFRPSSCIEQLRLRVIPPAVEEVIAMFDRDSAPLYEHAVRQALVAAREVLVNPSGPEKLGAWADFQLSA